MEYKTCSKCATNKPFADFHKNRTTKDGYQASCKICKATYAKEDRKNNKEKYLVRYKEGKVKYAEAIQKYREENKERIRAQTAEWRREHADRCRELSRNHYRKHAVKLREASRYWSTTNRGSRRAALARYRSSKKKATVAWADTYKIQLIYAKANRLACWMGEGFDVDHIVPLQSEYVCGLHCEYNLQILPTQDNKSKGNRWWPDMWNP